MSSPKPEDASTHRNDKSINSELIKLQTFLKIIEKFSPGSITVHTKIGQSHVMGAIDPKNLCMTEHQLSSGYVIPGDVEITVVGFVPKRKVEKATFAGLAGEVDITALWKDFIGEVDIVIDPIAIYTEINT